MESISIRLKLDRDLLPECHNSTEHVSHGKRLRKVQKLNKPEDINGYHADGREDVCSANRGAKKEKVTAAYGHGKIILQKAALLTPLIQDKRCIGSLAFFALVGVVVVLAVGRSVVDDAVVVARILLSSLCRSYSDGGDFGFLSLREVDCSGRREKGWLLVGISIPAVWAPVSFSVYTQRQGAEGGRSRFHTYERVGW